LAWYTGISKALTGFRGSTAVRPMETAGSAAEDLNGTGYIVTREKSYKLRGRQRYVTYADLLTNTMIAATGVRYFLNLIANAEWTFVPPEDEDGEVLEGAQEVADFVRDVFNDMESSWAKVVRRAARYRFQGFSWQEWTAKKREDGRIGFLDIEPRPCSSIERWDTDRGNSVLGVTQYVAGQPEIYLPRGKALYLVDDVLEDSPEGTGLLRHLVRAAERLRGYEELEELAFETDLRGIPIGRAPLKEMRDAHTRGEGSPGYLSLDQIKKARAAVDNFVRNKLLNKAKGAVLDSETYEGTTVDGNKSPGSVRKWDVELLKGEGGPHEAAAAAIQRINNEMARLLGIEHLMLGSDGTGSLALIGGKLSSFFLVVSSTLGEISEAVDRDLIGTICALNGIPKELWPESKPAEVDINDVEAVAQVLASLATAGAPLQSDDPAVDVVRSRVGLPPAPPPPELDEEDQALVDRMRAGLPVNLNTDPAEEPDAVEPGSEGAAAQKTAERAVNKLLKSLLGPKRERRS
jgi:hypothetical protein